MISRRTVLGVASTVEGRRELRTDLPFGPGSCPGSRRYRSGASYAKTAAVRVIRLR